MHSPEMLRLVGLNNQQIAEYARCSLAEFQISTQVADGTHSKYRNYREIAFNRLLHLSKYREFDYKATSGVLRVTANYQMKCV